MMGGMGLELVYVGFFGLCIWAAAYLASGFGFVYAYKRRRTNFYKSLIIGFLSLCVFVPTSIFLIKRIWPAHINVTLDDGTTIDSMLSLEKAHCFKVRGFDNEYYCDGIIFYLTVRLPDKTEFRAKAKNIGVSTYPNSRKVKSIDGYIEQKITKEELADYGKRKEEPKPGDFTESMMPQKISDDILAWMSPSIKLGLSHRACISKPDYRLCMTATDNDSRTYDFQFEISKN